MILMIIVIFFNNLKTNIIIIDNFNKICLFLFVIGI